MRQTGGGDNGRQFVSVEFAESFAPPGITLAQFVTHRFDLDEFEKAYEIFSDAASSGALKVVLTRSEAGEDQ